MAFELSSARSAGSVEDLIGALSAALQAQDRLLAALDMTAAAHRSGPRRRRALRATATRAGAARDHPAGALAAASPCARNSARCFQGNGAETYVSFGDG